MKLHIKKKYYSRVRWGEQPIKFRISQPKGIGTDVYCVIYLDPILKRHKDLREALLKHEIEEITDWAKGGKGSHSKARRSEPVIIRNLGGVSGFWREVKRRERG